MYSETFILPEPDLGETGAFRTSRHNATVKTSKPDKNQNAVVHTTDSNDIIRKKNMGAIPDSDSKISFNQKNQPGTANLLSIQAAVTDQSIKESIAQFADLTNYAPLKQPVADAGIAKVSLIRNQYLAIANDRRSLLSVLRAGKEEARKRANKMMAKIYRKIGFLTD
jgi:tryptophanyl-tRNA synthetase